MNNLIYTGRVTITVKDHKPIRTNNAGTPALFDALYNFLSRSFGSDYYNNAPTSIALINKTTDGGLDYTTYASSSITQGPLSINSTKHTESSVIFESLLNHSNIVCDLEEDADGTVLLLDAKNRILATTQFSLRTLIPVKDDINGQAVIQWEMSFANSTTEGDN